MPKKGEVEMEVVEVEPEHPNTYKPEQELLKCFGECRLKDRVERKTLLREYMNIGSFGVVVGVLAILMSVFYFFPAWDPMTRLGDFKIKLVVADAGLMTQNIGMTLAQGILANPAINGTLGWELVDKRGNMTDEYYQELVDDVENDRIWAFMYFPPNYTQNILLPCLGMSPLPTYSNPVEYVCDETKQYTSGAIIDRIMVTLFGSLSANVRTMMASGALPCGDAAPIALRVDPVVQNRITLHTLPSFGEYLGQYVPFTVLWVCSMFTVALSFVNFRVDATDRHKYRLPLVILQRLFFTLVLSFLASLLTTAILYAAGFQTEEHGFGVIFCVMWLMFMTFAGMVAFLFSYLSNTGIPICVIVLILQLMTSSGLFHRLSLPHGWFWVSDAFPFYHGVELIRATSYGLMSDTLSLHIGVPFAWLFGTWILAIIGQCFGIGGKLVHAVLEQGLHGMYFFSNWLI